MKSPILALFFAVSISLQLQAQIFHPEVAVLKKTYKSFRLAEVVSKSDSLLKTNQELSLRDSLAIYRLKGLAAYALADMATALGSFRDLLRADRFYQLNSSENPPSRLSNCSSQSITRSKNEMGVPSSLSNPSSIGI